MLPELLSPLTETAHPQVQWHDAKPGHCLNAARSTRFGWLGFPCGNHKPPSNAKVKLTLPACGHDPLTLHFLTPTTVAHVRAQGACHIRRHGTVRLLLLWCLVPMSRPGLSLFAWPCIDHHELGSQELAVGHEQPLPVVLDDGVPETKATMFTRTSSYQNLSSCNKCIAAESVQHPADVQ